MGEQEPSQALIGAFERQMRDKVRDIIPEGALSRTEHVIVRACAEIAARVIFQSAYDVGEGRLTSRG